MLPGRHSKSQYNPTRNKSFSISDWQHVCQLTSSAFGECGLPEIVEWLDRPTQRNMPRKIDQDGLDACICLLAALYLAEAKSCLMVGNTATGDIVVPYGENLNVLKLPAKDKDIFLDSIMQKLNLHSTDEPLVNYL